MAKLYNSDALSSANHFWGNQPNIFIITKLFVKLAIIFIARQNFHNSLRLKRPFFYLRDKFPQSYRMKWHARCIGKEHKIHRRVRTIFYNIHPRSLRNSNPRNSEGKYIVRRRLRCQTFHDTLGWPLPRRHSRV